MDNHNTTYEFQHTGGVGWRNKVRAPLAPLVAFTQAVTPKSLSFTVWFTLRPLFMAFQLVVWMVAYAVAFYSSTKIHFPCLRIGCIHVYKIISMFLTNSLIKLINEVYNIREHRAMNLCTTISLRKIYLPESVFPCRACWCLQPTLQDVGILHDFE